MKTRAIAVTTAVCAGALLTGIAFSGPAAARGGHDLRLQEKFLDTKATGDADKPVMGDLLAYTTDALDPKGTHIGNGYGECVWLAGKVKKGEYHCTETLRLKGGDIFSGGLYDPAPKAKCKWTVMGGTEKYRGSAGEYDFTAISADTFDEVIHFTN